MEMASTPSGYQAIHALALLSSDHGYEITRESPLSPETIVVVSQQREKCNPERLRELLVDAGVIPVLVICLCSTQDDMEEDQFGRKYASVQLVTQLAAFQVAADKMSNSGIVPLLSLTLSHSMCHANHPDKPNQTVLASLAALVAFCCMPSGQGCLMIRASGAIETACRGMQNGSHVGKLLRLELIAACVANHVVLKMMVMDKGLRAFLTPALSILMNPVNAEYHITASQLFAAIGARAERQGTLPPQCERLRGPVRDAHSILSLHLRKSEERLMVPCIDKYPSVLGINFKGFELMENDIYLICGLIYGDIFEIEALNLQETEFDESEAEQILAALKMNSTLLYIQTIGGVVLDVKAIAKSQSLELSGRGLRSSDVILACGIMSNKEWSFEESREEGILNLSSNRCVMDSACKEIARLLCARPGVTKVDLSDTSISPEGLSAIVTAIGVHNETGGHPSLTTVIVGSKPGAIKIEAKE